MVNQVDSTPNLPYIIMSCSDDETVKLWGVNSKVKIDIAQPSLNYNCRKFDVRNEEKDEAADQAVSNRRSRSSRSANRRRVRQSDSNSSSESTPSSEEDDDESNSIGSSDDDSDEEDLDDDNSGAEQTDEYDMEFNPEEEKDSQNDENSNE